MQQANTLLLIVRYPKWLFFMGIFSMAIFHFPLFLNNKIGFYKLMGSGKNGTFDKTPDWLQWSVLLVFNNHTQLEIPKFLQYYWHICKAEMLQIHLQPIEGHGFWDKQQPFGALQKQTNYNGPIAVLTRATIRLNKLTSFWKNVDAVAHQMVGAEGFITSFGIGEVPFIKQATFSIWQSKEAMKSFAYKLQEHATVIKKTRKENWYSEDMFVRFIPTQIIGTNQNKKIII
jgi:hypothetical protein